MSRDVFFCLCVCVFFFGGLCFVIVTPVLSGEVIKFDLRISHVIFSGGVVQPPTSEPPAGMTGKVMES